MPKFENLDLPVLKTKLTTLLVILPFSTGLFAGVQTAFMRGFTISMNMTDGPNQLSTYMYFLVAFTLCCF